MVAGLVTGDDDVGVGDDDVGVGDGGDEAGDGDAAGLAGEVLAGCGAAERCGRLDGPPRARPRGPD